MQKMNIIHRFIPARVIRTGIEHISTIFMHILNVCHCFTNSHTANVWISQWLFSNFDAVMSIHLPQLSQYIQNALAMHILKANNCHQMMDKCNSNELTRTNIDKTSYLNSVLKNMCFFVVQFFCWFFFSLQFPLIIIFQFFSHFAFILKIAFYFMHTFRWEERETEREGELERQRKKKSENLSIYINFEFRQIIYLLCTWFYHTSHLHSSLSSSLSLSVGCCQAVAFYSKPFKYACDTFSSYKIMFTRI